MVHPSYALNPGDMFQVDIDKVLYGTGEQKQGNENLQLEQGIKSRKKGDAEFIKAYRDKQAKGAKGVKSEVAVEAETVEAETVEGEEGEAAEVEEELGTEGERFVQKLRLRQLRRRARELLHGDLKNLSARQKKELRFFRDAAQRFLSRPDATKLNSHELMDELQLQIKSLYASVPSFKKGDPEAEGIQSKEETSEEKQKAAEAEKKKAEFRERVLEKGLEGIKDKKEIARARRIMEGAELTREELKRLAIILRNDMENPVDESKPYVTPWRPRAFMSAFAFIPRYLEVNPNICAAVYLRHPVARKGMAEVPTPFGYLTNQLAHNWYLGRG